MLGRTAEGDVKDIYIGAEIQKLKDMDPHYIPYRPIKHGVVAPHE